MGSGVLSSESCSIGLLAAWDLFIRAMVGTSRRAGIELNDCRPLNGTTMIYRFSLMLLFSSYSETGYKDRKTFSLVKMAL
jgi:hypothetical protein